MRCRADGQRPNPRLYPVRSSIDHPSRLKFGAPPPIATLVDEQAGVRNYICCPYPPAAPAPEALVPYILALDEGTTSARAIVFDHDGSIRAVAQKEFAQLYPKPGWVEHDPLEIWSAQISVAVEALGRAGISS